MICRNSSNKGNSTDPGLASSTGSVPAPEAQPADAVTQAPPAAAVPLLYSQMALLPTLHEDLANAGFEFPTPIQEKCIPIALEGKDIIGLAQTGTGKTAAFAIPIIQKLAHTMDLGALVLAPTRELAMQITKVFEELGRSSGVRTATIVGGIPMEKDYKALRSWPNVLVATPGRLNDHLENNTISLHEIQVLAVDEADRMHDMGFMPQIRRILAVLPRERQTLMFTATMPGDVERIARANMTNAVRIQVGNRSAPAHRARQQLFEVDDDQKTPLLLDLLRKSGQGRVLVFVRTKLGVDRLSRVVNARGISAAKIHGDREQIQRDEAMSGFREGKYRILIATDIAARGIDVENIEHVINYDFPRCPEDYVHRIGRTARQDAEGLATSFMTRTDRKYVGDVRKLIGDKLPEPEVRSNNRSAAPEEDSRRHVRPQRSQASGQQPQAAGEGENKGDGKARRRRRGGRGKGKANAAAAAAAAQAQTTPAPSN